MCFSLPRQRGGKQHNEHDMGERKPSGKVSTLACKRQKGEKKERGGAPTCEIVEAFEKCVRRICERSMLININLSTPEVEQV